MTRKMKILIPVIVIVLLGVLAVNIYFSILQKEEEQWRVIREKPAATQER